MKRQTVDPEIAALLDEEVKYGEATGSRFNRVDIPEGHSWLLRGIPVEVNPENGLPFLRLARHWQGKPCYCPRHTSPSVGGNIEAVCPMCDVTDRYANSADPKVQNLARRAQANAQYLIYVLVLAKEEGRDEVIDVPAPACWVPHEFWMSKTTFEDFLGFYKKGTVTKGKWSIFDWKRGNNFWATKDARKRTTLDKEDEGPFITTSNEAKFEKTVAKVLGGVRMVTVTLAKRRELQEMADKLEDDIKEILGSSGRRRRSSEEDDEDDEPKSKSRTQHADDDDPKPSRSSRHNDDEEDEDEDEDDEAPAKSSRKPSRASESDDDEEEEEEKPVHSSKKSKSGEDEDDDDDDDDEDDDDIDYSHPDKETRATDRKGADGSDNDDSDESDSKPKKPSEEDDDSDEEEEKPAKVVKKKSSGKAEDYEEDDVTDEAEDPVPPAKKAVIEDDDDDDDEETPPKVNADGASLGKAVRDRAKKLNR